MLHLARRMREKAYLLSRPWTNQPLVFIFSTGRTGTNFLARSFDRIEGVRAVHEPRPDLFDLGTGALRNEVSFDDVGTGLLLARRALWQKAKRRGEVLIESNPFLSYVLPRLVETLPHARYIFVHRRFETYLRSAFNKAPDGSGQFFFYAENDHRSRLTPHCVGDERFRHLWPSFRRHERIAWHWIWVNERAIDLLDAPDGPDVEVVRFEDLFSPETGRETLRRLMDWLDLPTPGRADAIDALGTRVNSNRILPTDDLESMGPVHSELRRAADAVSGRLAQLSAG